jgi:hypothetical protein
MNMDLLPKKSWFEDSPEITIEGNQYVIKRVLDDRYLIDLPDQYIQHEWLRLYSQVIQEVSKMSMMTKDYFVIKIVPTVREEWGQTTLQVKSEINAVHHREVSVPVPHFEPYPVTLKYLYKQWKADTKYNIRKWWKGLFK